MNNFKSNVLSHETTFFAIIKHVHVFGSLCDVLELLCRMTCVGQSKGSMTGVLGTWAQGWCGDQYRGGCDGDGGMCVKSSCIVYHTLHNLNDITKYTIALLQ